MSERRRYSPEYKQEAVQLVQKSDSPVAKIARNLGINENMLRRVMMSMCTSLWTSRGTGSLRSKGRAICWLVAYEEIDGDVRYGKDRW
jgi:transposase-like protein